jgi:hypothetical protein
MAQIETCPKCGADFPTRKGIVSGGVPTGYNALTDGGPPVKCPNCWHVFHSRRLRLFGALPPESLRWVVWGILAVCFALPFILKRCES